MTRSPQVLAALAVLGLVAARPAVAADACVAPKPGAVPFVVGEKLQYEIDSLGATIGSFSMAVLQGKGKDPYLIEARGKTGTFAATFYAVDAIAESRLGRALEGRNYFEDATEAGIRRTVDVAFPPPKGAPASIKATKQGNREDYKLAAPADTRDMLAALYAVRSMTLTPGLELCIPVFGARRIWMLRAKVAGLEEFSTPAGRFKTTLVSGTATRLDNPKAAAREVHFWIADDEARTPVAAFGLIQGKPVRAQLVSYASGRRKVAAAR